MSILKMIRHCTAHTFSTWAWYLIGGTAAWSLAVVVSLSWNILNEQQQTRELVKNIARVNLNKDLVFRRWGASHGGVYVPADQATPPNPYLSHVAERDITTPSGKQLTLMNPAYMIRQMMEYLSAMSGIRGRITSLKPLNPDNAPDEWERAALKAFEAGTEEVFEFSMLNQEPYVRLMRSLPAEESCLTCHAYQGYVVGDVRGGLGTSVLMTPYLREQQTMIRVMILSHVILWGGGMLGIGIVVRHNRQRQLERKSAQDALAENHRLLQTLINSTTDHLYMKDTDHRFVIANQATLHSLGAENLDEITRKSDRDFHTSKRAERFLQEERDIIESGKALINREDSVVDGETGTLRWLLTSKVPLRDERGNVYGIVGFNRDITERRRMAEALRESEKFLDTIIENIPDMIFVKDAQHLRFVRLNKAGEKLLGYSRQEFIGKSDYDFFPHDEADFFVSKDREVLERGVLLDIPEERINTRELGERILHTKKLPISDKDGKPMYLLGISEDITERKNTEAALNKRLVALTKPLDAGDIDFHDLFNIEDIQKIQDAFADATNVASIITNPDGMPLTKPSNFCRLCSQIIRGTERGRRNCFASDAAIGCQNPDGPIIQPCLSGGLWDAGASITVGGKHIANWLIGQVKNEEIDEDEMLRYARQIGADEDDFHEALQEVPVMSTEQFQKIATALFFLSNELSLKAYQNIQQARFITERQQAEAETRRLNAELEQRVRERTAKLEAANKELRSFAHVVSHDLKSPLRGIARLAHWLVNDYAAAFDEGGTTMAGQLIGRVQRLDSLIDGLLEYSEIGRVIGPTGRIDLNRLLPKVIESLAPPPGIRFEIAPELPVLVGEKDRIRQVFANLIDNAVKFMDASPGIIRVECDDADAEWRFSVTDNGPGIEPKYHDKIFQIFQTLTPRDTLESTGIGLSIVKKIVELYGGKIWVESDSHNGSTFVFTLPKQEENNERREKNIRATT